jgi:membrane protein DedA with SNARE-associated domain
VLLAGAAAVSPIRFAIAVGIGRGIRYFGQGYLAVLYGEQAAEFMRAHGTAIGIGLAVTMLAIGAAVFFLRRRRHGSAAA